ncbi:MAG: hypothetical protein V4757_07085 [Pseudomonadota bacterium]
MTRFPDWRLRFDVFMTARLRTPFAWGSNDCALFAADCVLAIAGVDLAAGMRTHRTATQAARVIRRHGGLAEIATRALGQPVKVCDAQQGDIVLMPQPHGHRELLSVSLGGDQVAAPMAHGMGLMPRASGLHAWRVG